MSTSSVLGSQVGLPFAARREQTELQLSRLEANISAWFVRRRQIDQDDLARYAGLHETRLANLQSVLMSAIGTLHELLYQIDIDPTREAGAVYDDCRALDQALVWLERVWEFYAEKFDQRDDQEQIGPLLKAADEVVWSCYHQVFIQKARLPDLANQRPVAPLAYIATDYSPATWESDKLAPSELRGGGGIEGLESFLLTLPIPVLRLPPWCVSAPWWLVFIAHEVGHDVLHDLKLVTSFREQLAQLAKDQGLPEADQKRWTNYSEEIFADLFSIVMMGRWAVRALLEIELTTQDKMVLRRGSYPAPAVRLALIAGAADRLGMDGESALCGLKPDSIVTETPLIVQDLKVARTIVDYVLGNANGTKLGLDLTGRRGTLEVLGALDEVRAELQLGGAVDKTWSANLSSKPPKPPKKLMTPRLVTCGAVAAWENTSRMGDAAKRRTGLQSLAKNTVDVLCQSGPDGVRSAPIVGTVLSAQGADLANLLLRASR